MIVVRLAASLTILVRSVLLSRYAKKHYPYVDPHAPPNRAALSTRWDALSVELTNVFQQGAGAILGFSLVAFGPTFLTLFTTDAAVIEAGMKRLTIMGFSYCVSAFMDNAIAACRGLGKSLVPMVIVISGSCIFRIIWVMTVFAWFKTIASLYLVYIFSWTITAAAEILYFIRCCRRLRTAQPAVS